MSKRLLLEYLIVTAILIVASLTPYKLFGMLMVICYLIVERIIRKRTKEDIGFNFKGILKGIKENRLFIVLVGIASPSLHLRSENCSYPSISRMYWRE